MKTICIITIFLLSFGLNAQRVKIHVSEVIDVYGSDSTVTDLINNNDSSAQFIREVNTIYDLDLTRQTFKYYAHDQLELEGVISYKKTGDMIEVSFLIEGFNVGLIINTNVLNERVVWYSDDADFKHICKFTEFEIFKSL
jgi:hypothetical protein